MGRPTLQSNNGGEKIGGPGRSYATLGKKGLFGKSLVETKIRVWDLLKKKGDVLGKRGSRRERRGQRCILGKKPESLFLRKLNWSVNGP